MIVAYILNGSFYSKHGNFCYVVNNPADWQSSYCLPVGVITYMPETSHQKFSPPVSLVLAAAAAAAAQADQVEPVPWNAPFRWQWRDDYGNYNAYKACVCMMLYPSAIAHRMR